MELEERGIKAAAYTCLAGLHERMDGFLSSSSMGERKSGSSLVKFGPPDSPLLFSFSSPHFRTPLEQINFPNLMFYFV